MEIEDAIKLGEQLGTEIDPEVLEVIIHAARMYQLVKALPYAHSVRHYDNSLLAKEQWDFERDYTKRLIFGCPYRVTWRDIIELVLLIPALPFMYAFVLFGGRNKMNGFRLLEGNMK